MSRKRTVRTARRAYLIEPLESRWLLAANIQLLDASLLDQNFNPVTSPTVGYPVYVRVDFTTTNLPANASYTISQTLYGVTYSDTINWGAGNAAPETWEHIYGGWPVQRGGATAATVSLDSTNAVAESNETDNDATIEFTPTQLQLPTTLAQPLGAVAERNYGYVNYADEDPTSPGFADYRGGEYTYDGHDAIDMTFPNFASMDAGVPVIAAEAGTVVALQDGNFDRNTVGMPDANFVEIDSGNGYQQYYYHLRDGSVGVQVGQTVKQGQVIGLMGSSGNSSGPHLHFALYNGGPVETYEDPYTYWQNPVPYQGDVDQIEDSGITNYDPGAILNAEERAPDYRNFKQQSNQLVYAWFSGFLAADEPMTFTYYRPNGSVYVAFNTNTGSVADRGGYYDVAEFLPTTPDAGTWQVALTVNGVELARNSFSVTASGASGARVDQGSTFVANTRTTPIDGGTYTQGASASAISFTVTDYGNAALNTSNLVAPAGWTITDNLVASLAPGASDTIGLKLDTTTSGYRYGFLTFLTNDPNATTYSFALEGEVDPTGSKPAVSIYTRDGAAAETGQRPGVFRVHRTGDTSNPLTVTLNIGGTATNGADYATILTTVIIPAGQSEASIIVTPNDEAAVESAETVIVSLASSSAYSIAPNNSATVTIADNDGTGTGAISGTVYVDRNFNTYRDSGEPATSGVSLFLDTNSDGVWESPEPLTTSDASGHYTFSGLVAGLFNVREIAGAFSLATPVGAYKVATSLTTTVDLGVFPTAFNGAASADTFIIAPDSNPARLDITVDGVLYTPLRSQLPTIFISGNGGADSLTADLSGGVPFASQIIIFDGGGGTDAVSMTGGALVFAAGQKLSSLTIAAGAFVFLTGDSTATSVQSLSNSGTIDVGDTSLIIDYTGASPINQIRGLLQSGFDDGAWDGVGIHSSIAAANPGHALGYAEASKLGLSTFGGQQVDATAIVIRYTKYGDNNLDGTVDIGNDFSLFLDGYASHGTGWLNGDYTYDNKIDLGNDFNLFLSSLLIPSSPGFVAAASRPVASTPAVLIPSPTISIGQSPTIFDQLLTGEKPDDRFSLFN